MLNIIYNKKNGNDHDDNIIVVLTSFDLYV